MYQQINLAIIGCGKWGSNHVRTACRLLKSNLRMVCDVNTNIFSRVKGISDSIPFTSNLQDVLNDRQINSVIIATPSPTHYQIAKKSLQFDKHVLVEKPLTLFADEAKDLIKVAREQKRILMVGHVLLYHPAVVRIKEEISKGRIGAIQYIYSHRLNLGTLRTEENILWSFAPHDISIIQYLTDSFPIYVDAKGSDFIQNNVEDTTITYLVYPHNVHAHIFVSWLHPFKEHRLTVIGSEGMFVFQDHLQEHKLKFYPNGYHENNGHIEKFEGKFEIMEYAKNIQPLEAEQKHFFECVINNCKPLTDGMHALEVLEILERAQHRLRDYIYDSPIREATT